MNEKEKILKMLHFINGIDVDRISKDENEIDITSYESEDICWSNYRLIFKNNKLAEIQEIDNWGSVIYKEIL